MFVGILARLDSSRTAIAMASGGGEIVVWVLETGGCSAKYLTAFFVGGDDRWVKHTRCVGIHMIY